MKKKKSNFTGVPCSEPPEDKAQSLQCKGSGLFFTHIMSRYWTVSFFLRKQLPAAAGNDTLRAVRVNQNSKVVGQTV